MNATAPAPGRRLVEIQALRAVAVMLVVLYHVWPGRLTGGYVGVDVFFVISGFLITAHLLREHAHNGRVALAAFWVRRIKRLLPAALLVLAACIVLAFTVLPAVVREETLRQAGAAAAYGLNWVLAFDAVDYLASDNAATVVQHYWTLSVEEQFYVVWPLLLVAALALAARARRSRNAAVVVGVVAAGVVAVSFAYSVYLTWFSPAFAFFATPTRAWEFAVGGLLAAVIAKWPHLVEVVRAHPLVRRAGLVTIAGLALIVGSAVVLTSESPFPGYRAAFPVLGAALVIAGGLPTGLGLSRVLGWRPVQFVGDISYSLYLWHWPIIVTFLLLAGGHPSPLAGVGIVALSVLLAAGTRVWVEEPARRAVVFSRTPVAAFALALGGAIVFLSVSGVTSYTTQQQLAQERAAWEHKLGDEAGCFGANATLGTGSCPDPFVLRPSVDVAAAASDIDKTDWCLTWYDQDWTSCELGDRDAPNGTIALVGDSHAAALVPALDRYFAANGIRMITYLRFACPGLGVGTDGYGDSRVAQQERACRVWSDRVRDEITSRADIDTVVYTNFGSSYSLPSRAPEYQLTVDDIVETWSGTLDAGKSVISLVDPPVTGGDDVPLCLAGKAGQDAPCSHPRTAAAKPDPNAQAAAALGGRVTTVDLTDAYCDELTCYSVIGDVVVYADSNHVSGTWARTLMGYLGPQLLDGMLTK